MKESIKVVEKKRAHEDIVTQIRDLIANRTLKQGDQLPPEHEISKLFKVSRSTIREALRSLEAQKLVESRNGAGTFVLASSAETSIRPLADALYHKNHDDLREIYYLRRIVEPHLAALAAINATPAEIEELTKVIHDQAEAMADDRGNGGYVPAFYNCMSRMSKKRILERLLLAILDISMQIENEYYNSEFRSKKSFEGHCKILAAIKDRNSTAARTVAQQHLDEVELILLSETGQHG